MAYGCPSQVTVCFKSFLGQPHPMTSTYIYSWLSPTAKKAENCSLLAGAIAVGQNHGSISIGQATNILGLWPLSDIVNLHFHSTSKTYSLGHSLNFVTLKAFTS